jgi:XTP/dITP diphosphohydrolase
LNTQTPYLLVATENPGKLIELQALLAQVPARLVSPSGLGLSLHVVEDGSTYAENAARKALAYAKASGLISLADDSGLEVDALNGQPGLYSARFAPQPDATDADRRAYLLSRLEGIPRPWTARFHCTVALAPPEGDLLYATGECLGEIIPQERGSQGFGYDPIFWIPGLKKTMAELDLEEKNLISHRANAVRNAIPAILKLTGGA